MQALSFANGTKAHTDWSTVNWRKANRVVRNLRQRIFRASQNVMYVVCLSRVR